jgi:hypothetical protein
MNASPMSPLIAEIANALAADDQAALSAVKVVAVETDRDVNALTAAALAEAQLIAWRLPETALVRLLRRTDRHGNVSIGAPVVTNGALSVPEDNIALAERLARVEAAFARPRRVQ